MKALTIVWLMVGLGFVGSLVRAADAPATQPATVPASRSIDAPLSMPAPVDVGKYTDRIKLACVGDSITAGYGVAQINAYPEQLSRMLGDQWVVANFGVSGATLLIKGDKPYQLESNFTRAIDLKPDVVIIMLGTNDSKPNNLKLSDLFVSDYKDLIAKFKSAEPNVRIYIARPCVVLGPGAFNISEAGIKQIIPLIDAVAKETEVGLVDIHAATEDATKKSPGLIPDNVHPNIEGATIIAKTFYRSLLGKEYEGASVVLDPGRKE